MEMVLRSVFVLGVCAAVGLVFADELITIPTGLRVPDRQFSFRSSTAQSLRGKSRFSLATGYASTMELRGEWFDGRLDGSAALQLLPSLADRIPGIMVGIEQVGNQFHGRSAYGVFTFEFNQYGERNATSPVQLTLGGGSGRLAGLFMGLKLPATNEFAMITEYDTSEIAAGIEVKLRDRLKTQWVFRRGSTSLQFELRF